MDSQGLSNCNRLKILALGEPIPTIGHGLASALVGLGIKIPALNAVAAIETIPFQQLTGLFSSTKGTCHEAPSRTQDSGKRAY
jgi:hypothetical protein